MEFRDLKTQYLENKDAINLAIQNVIYSSHFIEGEQVKCLEEQLADYVGVKHCITCANGTDALQLALLAWKIGEGDAVFVPDFTFFSTAEVVPWVRATPVFVDVDSDTYNISPASLERSIQHVLHEGRLVPKAVIAVDLFGQPADFNAIREITAKYGLLLLEDGAQGFGGKIEERRACSFGDVGTTSFFPAKPLGCYGDGGAVFTDNDEWAELIRSYKVHGKGMDKYDNIRIGMNSRLDTIQAAILIEKLRLFDQELDNCNVAAAKYNDLLKDVVKTPVIMSRMYSCWAQYTICLENFNQRENVIKAFKQAGIPYGIYYKKPMHMQSVFNKLDVIADDYIVSEHICATCLSLPMHAYLRTEEIEMVCNTMKAALGKL